MKIMRWLKNNTNWLIPTIMMFIALYSLKLSIKQTRDFNILNKRQAIKDSINDEYMRIQDSLNFNLQKDILKRKFLSDSLNIQLAIQQLRILQKESNALYEQLAT